MRTTISLVLSLALGVVLLTANAANAGGFKFGGGGGGGGGKSGGGMKMSFGGNNSNHTFMKKNDNHNDHHDMHHNDHHDWWYYSHKPYYNKYYSYPYVRYYSQPVPVVVNTPVITTAPTADISVLPEDIARTQVPMGGTLLLSGQAFGGGTGSARLVIANRAFAVQVLNWSDTGVKIQLPKLTGGSTLQGDLEVLRADGSLASKSAIELIPVTADLAQAK
jgi:hypothetical protein